MDEKGWIYQLPKGGDELHPVPAMLQEPDTEAKRQQKAGTVGKGLLSGKPVAKEILAVRICPSLCDVC